MSPPKAKRDMLQELHQAVIGIPDNPDENGMIGDIKEIKDILKTQNNRIRNNERNISRVKGILVGLSVIISGGLGLGISRLLG